MKGGEEPLIINPIIDSSSSKTPSIVDDFMYGSSVAQSHVTIRLGFLRKVYGILSAQLAFTTVVSALIMSIPGISDFVKSNAWLLVVNMILTLVILFALMAKRTEYPTNYQLLIAFTVCESFMIGVVVSLYDVWIVIQAFLITTTIVGALTIYTLQSKRDFSAMGGVLFSLLWTLIIGGFIQLLFPSETFNFVLALGGAFLFSCFIIYDTHMIMKQLNAEEYIVGVINLYLDIINLFLEILRLLNSSRRN